MFRFWIQRICQNRHSTHYLQRVPEGGAGQNEWIPHPSSGLCTLQLPILITAFPPYFEIWHLFERDPLMHLSFPYSWAKRGSIQYNSFLSCSRFLKFRKTKKQRRSVFSNAHCYAESIARRKQGVVLWSLNVLNRETTHSSRNKARAAACIFLHPLMHAYYVTKQAHVVSDR
jgi:hypothetical protein